MKKDLNTVVFCIFMFLIFQLSFSLNLKKTQSLSLNHQIDIGEDDDLQLNINKFEDDGNITTKSIKINSNILMNSTYSNNSTQPSFNMTKFDNYSNIVYQDKDVIVRLNAVYVDKDDNNSGFLPNILDTKNSSNNTINETIKENIEDNKEEAFKMTVIKNDVAPAKKVVKVKEEVKSSKISTPIITNKTKPIVPTVKKEVEPKIEITTNSTLNTTIIPDTLNTTETIPDITIDSVLTEAEAIKQEIITYYKEIKEKIKKEETDNFDKLDKIKGGKVTFKGKEIEIDEVAAEIEEENFTIDIDENGYKHV